MTPPTANLNLDVEAISGICGSISIACWVVVFSPQIIQNFQRSSADALSIQFIIVWLLGDVFNILGAVLQGVLPTMIILAIYYTIADIVLLGQCFYYRGFTWRDAPTPAAKPNTPAPGEPNERTGLIAHDRHEERRGSDWSGLSPAVPHIAEDATPQTPTILQTVIWNTIVVLMVIAAGVVGWFLGQKASTGDKHGDNNAGGEDSLHFMPWTADEDLMLMNYVTAHGEGRWNSLARRAGLRRTGKSCRLRWLNYLRPDVRRGNITPEEQLLILELHFRLGNRWSKIARHLPGRTDNEIKNYWRTRVQKQAKQLRCDVNSKQFRDILRSIWMPRLVERIREASSSSAATAMHQNAAAPLAPTRPVHRAAEPPPTMEYSFEARLSSPPASESVTESRGIQGVGVDWMQGAQPPSPGGYAFSGLPDVDQSGWGESLWSVEDIWLQQQQQL